MEGPWTRFPIAGRSIRQGCVSNSTPEAEMVACHWTYKNIVLPMFEIWDAFLPAGWRVPFHEDTQAMIRVIRSGKNPTMKTLKRCHGVDLLFLHERLSDVAGTDESNSNRDPCDLKDTISDRMAADIYTKAFTTPESWQKALNNINVCPSVGGSLRQSPHKNSKY